MEVDVRREAEVEAGPARQEAAREVERDAVEVLAQERREPDVADRHEREGREEVLAELAVGDPRAARLGRLEREGVDVDRPPRPALRRERSPLPREAAGARLILALPARAKLNLSLAVTGVRSDGYHEVDSVLRLIDSQLDVSVGAMMK